MAIRPGPHEDVFGHGTACAGIIHALAPEARITSVRVLGPGLTGRAAAFHAGLVWAVDEGFDVINLSLGTTKREWALAFHEVCDRAYFGGSFIVTAANNVARVSYPSLYASVASVACNTSDDALRFHANPNPPTEFLARGIDVEVPWIGGGTTTSTGNSYAAPHIAAFAALVKSKHPELRPFELKSVLWATAANVAQAARAGDDLEAPTAAGRRAPAPSAGPSTAVIVTRHLPRRTPAEAPATPTAAPEPTVIIDAPRAGPPPPGPTPPATPLPGAAPTPLLTSPRSERWSRRPDPSPSTPRPRASRPAPASLMVPGYVVDGEPRPGPWGTLVPARRSGDGAGCTLHDLRPVLGVDRGLAAEVVAAVRRAGSVTHPHLEPVVEVVTLPGPLVVTPRSVTDAAALSRSEALSFTDVLAVALAVTAGLAALHERGLVHGDVRAAKAVVDAHGTAALGWSGVAVVRGSPAGLTELTRRPAALDHLSPEQLRGQRPDPRSDVFGVGVLLSRLLTGRSPRPEVATVQELVDQARTGRPGAVPAASLAPALPPAVTDLIDRATSAEPGLRPPDAFHLGSQLGAAARTVVDGATLAASPLLHGDQVAGWLGP